MQMTASVNTFNRPATADSAVCRPMVAWTALAVLAIAVLAGPARAHKVTLFAWVEKGTVYAESKFGGGRTPKDSAVIVTDLAGNTLLEVVTDTEGRCSFPAPAVPGIKLTLHAGQGHLAQWTVSAEELADSATTPPAPPEPAATVVDEAAADDVKRQVPPADADRLTIDGIRRAIGDPLATELQALRTEVRRLRREIGTGPSVTDILGGIGYIIGLVGIGAYFKNRRKPASGKRHDA